MNRTLYFRFAQPQTIYNFASLSKDYRSYLDFENDEAFKPILKSLPEGYTLREHYLYITGAEVMAPYLPRQPALYLGARVNIQGLDVSFNLLKKIPTIKNVEHRRIEINASYKMTPFIVGTEWYKQKKALYDAINEALDETEASIKIIQI